MKDLDIRLRNGGDDAIAAACELMPKWIPVSERLPSEDVDVLLTDGHEVAQAWFDAEDGWQTWHTSNGWRGARHWMPLPEPPETT